ncbi:ribbon-helix-helix protein [Gluconobacter cerinus]
MTGRRMLPGFAARPADPERWVTTPEKPAPPNRFTARLTIDVTPALRGRLKVAAFQRGITVAGMLRALLAREFPDTSGDVP